MNRTSLALSIALALTASGGCKKSDNADNGVAPTKAAAKAAGDETIAKGLAAASTDSKFVSAIKAAGLEPTLAGPGPYTVLVPDDQAFAKLPAGALDALMAPAGKRELIKLLTFHVLPGTMRSADIAKAIDGRNGKALLITMQGGTLTAIKAGGKLVLTDDTGDHAVVTGADDKRSNGIVHHLDTVLMPKS